MDLAVAFSFASQPHFSAFHQISRCFMMILSEFGQIHRNTPKNSPKYFSKKIPPRCWNTKTGRGTDQIFHDPISTPILPYFFPVRKGFYYYERKFSQKVQRQRRAARMARPAGRQPCAEVVLPAHQGTCQSRLRGVSRER